MSREDFVILASRTLAVLMMVWALTEVSYVPTTVHSFLHYSNLDIVSHSPGSQYYKHSELISLCFRFFRIVGFSLLARWLFKGDHEVFDLLLPTTGRKIAIVNDGR
jgi:hypothetical protein